MTNEEKAKEILAKASALEIEVDKMLNILQVKRPTGVESVFGKLNLLRLTIENTHTRFHVLQQEFKQ